MRRLVLAGLTLAALGVFAGPAAPAQHAPLLHCKYGSKYVVKTIHGHKRRVKVCKAKPKPKPKPPQADLDVTMDATLETVTAGNHVAYAVVVENNGPAVADDTVLTLDVPGEIGEIISFGGDNVGGGCEADSAGETTHVECLMGTLDTEDSSDSSSAYAYVNLVAEPSSAGDFTFSARAKSATKDPNAENNTATRTLHVLPGPPAADLAVSLATAPDPGSIPGGFTETISVTNTGPTEATDVTATVLLPQGASLASLPPFLTDVTSFPISSCSYGYGGTPTTEACWSSIASGETRTAEFSLAPSIHSPATLRSDVVVDAYTPDSNLANNRASALTALAPFQPKLGADLVAHVDPPTEAVAGKFFAFGFRIANVGLGDAHDVHVQLTTTPVLSSLSWLLFSNSFNPIGCAADPSSECTLPELGSDVRLAGLAGAAATSPGTYSATLTVTSPDVSEPVTATTTFEVKPSPARR
jgi:uncharacterized repeat protein (TIGR01451 family)